MKTASLTIRLDKDLDRLLTRASKRAGKNRSEIAREALRRQLRLQQFEALRKRIMPFAEALTVPNQIILEIVEYASSMLGNLTFLSFVEDLRRSPQIW